MVNVLKYGEVFLQWGHLSITVYKQVLVLLLIFLLL